VGDGLPVGIEHYLRDRHVVILTDNDDPGRQHAEKKAEFAEWAKAASIRVVHFPELPAKGDVSDLIENGGTAEQLWTRIDATTEWLPSPTISSRVKSPPCISQQSWSSEIVMANDLQSMIFPPVRYVLPDYIPEGVTIIAGKPKIGKSWLTLDLCLAATANRFTLGTLKPAQGDVLYLALEDNKRRLKRRMAKLWPSPDAQWPKRLALVTEWKRADQGGLDNIEAWCRSVTDPVMVVIDTLEKFRPAAAAKSSAYSNDYAALTDLQKIASKYRVAIVINHHVRKMEADDPFDTVSGTLGLTGAADTILILKRHAGTVTLHAPTCAATVGRSGSGQVLAPRVLPRPTMTPCASSTVALLSIARSLKARRLAH
jgi:AAA domain